MPNETELSESEQIMLNKMLALEQLSFDIAKKLQVIESELYSTNNELDAMRRKTITLQEENQHLREMLQTWRERMKNVLAQLGELD